VSEKTAQIVAQYITRVYSQAHVRPYENKHPLSNDITGSLKFEPLPEDGHWRVELELGLQGVNSEDVLCFDAGCAVEAIVFLQGLEPEEIEPVLTHNIAALMVGTVRTAITNASLATGYGPVTLPPMAAAQLESLAKNSQTQ